MFQKTQKISTAFVLISVARATIFKINEKGSLL